MRHSKRVNFKDLVKIVEESRCGHQDLSIWGGRCAQNSLKEFLSQWDLVQMPYQIWEYASEICFEKNTVLQLQNETLLERGRLFGQGGDLELRRIGADLSWRFIGPKEMHPPNGDNSAKNYWETHPEAFFHVHEEKALLWGQWNAEKSSWTDDRVAAAQLNYPAPTNWQRVQVVYKAFIRAGHVEFIWFTGLNEYREGNNG